MAESIADAMGKEDKIGQLSARRMNSFTTDSILGFGEYRVPFDSGVGGANLVYTLKCIAISQRHEFFRFVFRFFSAESTWKAISAANFGPYAHLREKEDCILLGDFRGKPRGQLEAYHPPHAKPVRKQPVTISGFQETPNQQTLLIEAAFGVGNGNGRRRAAEFFVVLHRDDP